MSVSAEQATKATVKTPQGATVTIEGSVKQVRELIRALEGGKEPEKEKGPSGGSKSRKKGEASIPDMLLELREAGFFKKARGLGEIKSALEGEGHIIPLTTLSGKALILIRKKELRRFKEGGTWKYVNR